jgi:hypothetical protein
MQGLNAIIVPHDIGRVNPAMTTWMKIGTEKMAMKPHERAELDVGLHCPRLGTSEKTVDGRKLQHYRRYKQDKEQSVAFKL